MLLIERVKEKLKGIIVTSMLLTLTILLACSTADAGGLKNEGWWFPYIGRFNGEWELSTGVHFWDDHLKLRNLQLRSSVDLAPGLRGNMVLRSNKEFDSLQGFEPAVDELYLEGYGFHYGEEGTFSTSLKVGKMRYLRFPYPDLISTYDQVPGTEDLRHPGAETGYRGAMLTLDYASRSGLGYHLTGINWDLVDRGINSPLFGSASAAGTAGAVDHYRSGTNVIENYLYYRKSFGLIDLEARVGEMQIRHPSGGINRGKYPYQLGECGPGYNIYLGANWRGYRVGVLYEDLYDREYDVHDVRTGLMVTFAFSRFTELLGSVRADYTRSPEGFVAHLPLLKGKIGNLKEEAPEGGELVGEIEAERVTTYWQNGQGRNFYEHRLSHWGETPASSMTEKNNETETVDSSGALITVIKKEPWHLRLEALVSPHTEFKDWEDLVEWEKHRQGPAQLCQRVTYQFYRVSFDVE